MSSSENQKINTPPPPNQSTNKSITSYKFIDIGANLLDEMYQGNYRGKVRHEADLNIVLKRAFHNHVHKIIITCGTLNEAKRGIELAKTNDNLFCTVGVHPTRCSTEFGCTEEEWDECLNNLESIVKSGVIDGHVVALGEMGLDYARVEFCNVDIQKKGFITQLKLAKKLNLPMFLHNRDTGYDLVNILKEYYFDILHDNISDNDKHERISRMAGGVVHSFDDTLELAQQFIDLDLFIGINGCSLKKEENLKVVKEIHRTSDF